jgi:hypothetical protein
MLCSGQVVCHVRSVQLRASPGCPLAASALLPAVADGCFKEVLPAIQLNKHVIVLSKAEVLRGFGGATADSASAADVAAALARYEANWSAQDATEPESGARSNGFWFDSTFVSESVKRLQYQLPFVCKRKFILSAANV